LEKVSFKKKKGRFYYDIPHQLQNPKHLFARLSMRTARPTGTQMFHRVNAAKLCCLPKVAGSHYEKWPDLTMKSGRISLWKVAGSHYEKLAGSQYEKWQDLNN